MQPSSNLVDLDGATILEVSPNQSLFGSGEDPNDLISLLWGAGAKALLAYDTSFAPAFFDLKSGLAGAVFQKLVNYRLPAALVMEDLTKHDQRVQELAHDHRRHPVVRFFSTREAALDWLKTL